MSIVPRRRRLSCVNRFIGVLGRVSSQVSSELSSELSGEVSREGLGEVSVLLLLRAVRSLPTVSTGHATRVIRCG